MNENKESEWKNRERGALWKKQGKSQNYLTGVIKSLDDMGQEVKNKVIVFANKNKTSENAPDFIIYESKDMNQADSAASDALPPPRRLPRATRIMKKSQPY